MALNLCVLVMMVSAVTSFVTPTSTSISGGGVLAEESRSYTKTGVSLSATVDAAVESKKSSFKFDNYNKPIVLLGLSSGGNELQRLALSLSASLVGNNPQKMQSTLEKLERSQGALLVAEDDDDEDDNVAESTKSDEQVAGISLSAVGLDEEGPFVLDAGLIGELIREKTLSLTSGVLVLDFNHPAFHTKEFEVDLIRALSSVAKQLYEELGLLSVYVNVQPDDVDSGMSDEAKERKGMIEKDVLIPFSDYEICVKNEGTADASSWDNIEWELQRMVGRALLSPPVVGGTGANSADLMMGLNTFFLSLSFPHVEDASPYIEQMCQDVDSMEYRVDLLQAAKDYLAKASSDDDSCDVKDPRFDILYQQQRLRSMCRPYAQRAPALPFAGSGIIDDALPIVYTVRTAHQAGTWPDDEDGIKHMFDLLELGLRSGVEVLDVESAWDAKLTDKLMKKAKDRHTSLILGSHHVVGEEVSMDEAIELYRQCRMGGRAHGAKVVLSINGNDNDEDQLAYKASLAAAKLDKPEIPNIGLILGEAGSYSRILNPRFTPVTHETLPFKAAPGQLTAAEIMAGRLLTGQVPTERYAILGHNIAYSVSPQMQGSAFAAVKLPHTYTRADVATVEEFVEGPIWNDDNFGGCSVTIPHKANIIPHVDVLTDAAKDIGSVNTVIVKKDKKGTRVLIGDNTDWKGIYNPLQRRIGDDIKSGSYALILGGGGTARAAAYAAAKLGLERIYYNRTPDKARDLATEFGGFVASSLDNDTDNKDSLGSILAQNQGHIQVVISTLPAAAEFELPEWMLSNNALPVVFDVNYKPYNTALLLQTTAKGCDVVRGSEMLWEQGVGQFELWTGRTAPYGVMKKVVLENCLPSEAE
jgi:shikimate-5-dehydrogenase/3-dehydroquinate dehydratase type I